jgi:CRP-like cAMP-binding protein
MAEAGVALQSRLKPANQRLTERGDLARFLIGRHFLDEIHMLSGPNRLDPAMILIAETVAIGTMERSFPRNGHRLDGHRGDGSMPRPRPMSRRAIALATGLPRETVRRRLARLVELGLLQEEAGGIACAEGFIRSGREQMVSDMLARHVALTNQLIAEGLIESDGFLREV